MKEGWLPEGEMEAITNKEEQGLSREKQQVFTALATQPLGGNDFAWLRLSDP